VKGPWGVMLCIWGKFEELNDVGLSLNDVHV
jgi:hypothetical protein